MLKIDPNSDTFRWWLIWLVDEKNWTAHEIIDATFESHKYQSLQVEYLEYMKEER